MGSADKKSSDLIYFMGTHGDPYGPDIIDQSVRLFPDTESAQAFMADLADNISGCTSVTSGSGMNQYTAEVSPAPEMWVPTSVAQAGWIRTGDPGPRWRSYVFDMQRGNMIVRTRLLTDGTVTEFQFRRFMGFYASQLAAIEPANK